MPVKSCEVCGTEFNARLNRIRTCGVQCRNRLISSEREAKHRMVKSCEVCKTEFEVGSDDKNKRTCSDACGYALRGSKTSKRVEMSCVTCSGVFAAVRSQIAAGGGKYCSKACMYDRNKSGTTRKCECCEKEFSTPPSQLHVKTCSTECGYKIRHHPNQKEKVTLQCLHCGCDFQDRESRAGVRRFCSSACFFDHPTTKARKSETMSGERNPGWKGGVSIKTVSASGKAYSRSSHDVETERTIRRQRAKRGATPSWADIEKIREFYRLSRQLTRMTGIKHHVDHMVPLTSNLVCGFHSQHNLQIIPATDNLKKANLHWPDMW